MNPSEFSQFLHKYAIKYDQILAKILKQDKDIDTGNPIKQMRQILWKKILKICLWQKYLNPCL